MSLQHRCCVLYLCWKWFNGRDDIFNNKRHLFCVQSLQQSRGCQSKVDRCVPEKGSERQPLMALSIIIIIINALTIVTLTRISFWVIGQTEQSNSFVLCIAEPESQTALEELSCLSLLSFLSLLFLSFPLYGDWFTKRHRRQLWLSAIDWIYDTSKWKMIYIPIAALIMETHTHTQTLWGALEY